MSWPTMSDYQEAIQNPASCFSDEQLKRGSPALNALGLPQPVTGGFCSVYQVTNGRSRWAVRCFLHNIRDLQERYAQISRFLKKKKFKHMVGFEYVREGIRVRGTWHPVLKMEWVDGDTLNVWVEKHLKDPKALLKLAERWGEVVEALERAGIGHCDLQHGNILVDGSGNLKLIDYDGMYVPPLRGRGSHEKGHPAYQHPQRDGKNFDEKVDRFSALVIQASLLAVAQSPELWKRFYEEDNLIFRRSDFQNPDAAPVFAQLKSIGGPVADVAEALREACKRPLSAAPRLRDLKLGQAASPAPPKAAPAAAKPAPPAPAKAAAKPAAQAPAKVAAKAPPAPAPKTAPAAAKPAAQATAKVAAKPATKPTPPAPARVAAKPAAKPAHPAPAKVAAKPAAPAPAPPQSGWTVEWTRPGPMREKHVLKVPVYGTRAAPRRILGLTLGTRSEQFVERYDEELDEHELSVGGHRAAVTSLAFSADGRVLASGSRDRTVRVWNTPGGREASAPLDAKAGVVAIALLPNRSVVAAALDDRRLVLWDYGLQRQVIHFDSPDRSRLKAVAVSSDGRWVAAGGAGRRIYVWQTDRGTLAGELKHTAGRIEALAFTPDGSGIVCGTHKGCLELFDRAGGSAKWSTRTALRRIVALVVPPRGTGVVGGAADGTIGFWDLKDGSESRHVTPEGGSLASLAVAPDGALFIAGLTSGKARLTEAGTDREVAVLEGHPGPVTAAALPGTGKSAATGAADGSVRLWLAA